MADKIKVWHDGRLPQSVISAANKLETPHNLRNLDGVDTWCVNVDDTQVNYLIADGHCGRHVDWEEISFIWVARNDTKSWVGAKQQRAIRSQPVGTLILLDIGWEHYLQQNKGVNGKVGVWAGVLLASLKEWPTEDESKEICSEFCNAHRPKELIG